MPDYIGTIPNGAALDAAYTKLAGIEAGATADQTGAEIKAAYEAEADTNAYTDAEKTKLAGIEAAADVTDATNVEAAGAVMDADIGVTVQPYDADTLKADTGDNLTAGFTTTPYDAGTQSSGSWQPDALNGNIQTATNGGAHTLTPPANSCSICVKYTNNGSAGAITTSGFTITTGDTYVTTDTYKFLFYLTNAGGDSHLHIVALQ